MDVLARLTLRLTDNGEPPDEDILLDCMESAKYAILTRRYPYGNMPDEIEPRYQDLQFRIAMDLYNKIGAEGELIHIENGMDRHYESSWISAELLEEVTPFCGVIS